MAFSELGHMLIDLLIPLLKEANIRALHLFNLYNQYIRFSNGRMWPCKLSTTDTPHINDKYTIKVYESLILRMDINL